MSKSGDIPAIFHCPLDGKFVSNVQAEEYGELKGVDSYNPYYKWHVMGDCKTHGRVEVKDHDGEDRCMCFTASDWECWFEIPEEFPL